MMKSTLGAACATVLVALAGNLATPTASHAVVYGGIFDPRNENYRWFGTHVFDVSAACLDSDGWRQANSYDSAGCSARLIGGDLTVVNRQPPAGPEVSRTIKFSSFPFIPTSDDPSSSPRIWGVNVFGGELVGVDSFNIGNFTFGLLDVATHDGLWLLRWSSGRGDRCLLYDDCEEIGSSSAGFNSPLASPPDPGNPSVSLTNLCCGSEPGVNPLVPRTSTTITFQRQSTDTNAVPEPTTVTLVLAALGATWLTRRRRLR